jgi:acyl carrier protein
VLARTRNRQVTDLSNRLIRFVREDLLNGRDVALDSDTPLFDEGIVDSLAILRLIAFLELRIGRSIADHEIVMEHFTTVGAIDRYFGGGGGGSRSTTST